MKLYWTVILFLYSLTGLCQEEPAFSYTHSAQIKNYKYSVFTGLDGTYVIKGQDTLLHLEEFYISVEFRDFNKDGYKDLFLDLGGNTPERYDLLLFNPKELKFVAVKDFRDFPAPVMIPGTWYYYSYHKSGCADLNWDSDLFYIKGNKVIKIGTISGRECNDSGVKDGLYVYKQKRAGKKLYKSLPIQTIYKYKEHKWGFIKQYWERNFKDFVQ